MPKTMYNGSKVHINIGTIGHLGHGKSTLTAAITKVLSSKVEGNREVHYDNIHYAQEDIEQRFRYFVSRLEYETKNHHFTHFDHPNHIENVKSMIINEMDAAILVVDATQGIMAETIKDIELSKQIGATSIVVFINKCDQIDDSNVLAITEQKIRELLNENQFSGNDIPIIRGSAIMALENPSSQWGDKIMELMEAIDRWILEPQSEKDKPFLMEIERVESIPGRGTVARGKIERGVIHVRDGVEIIGLSEEVKRAIVTDIDMFRRNPDSATVGDEVGLLLPNIQRIEIKEGQVLAAPNAIHAHKHFTAMIYMLTRNEGGLHSPIANKSRPQFYFRKANIVGTCELPGEDKCLPGQYMYMVIDLIVPIAMEPQLSFTIQESGRTIAIGKVISIMDF